ncbi:hypothetical protein AC792_06945 [Arthrobacter sp. RIT-PI-e]|uniref:SurA N-terminal domain-containing protein n=1 Tax=Arthrobacter sp. RIT-PI-e TaxID=1681197 RepID=UPI0006762F1C|nr:SurA N-terminal domain-containing protein [Arthrobacter sp. RIT-PI-e]KNC19316.1 hypothetical protein AC792_06945 [Arthrobacter sp. RIT-PI-e]
MTISGTVRRRRLAAAVLIGAVALLTGCSGSDDAQVDATSSAAAEASAPAEAAPDEQPPAPEPDLADLPDVVAVVNGTDIGRDEFTSAYEAQFPQAVTQAQLGGQELDQDLLKSTVADNLVSTELLRQEADERGVEVTDEARTAAIEDLLASSGLGSEEELRAAFAEQGLDDAEFDSQLDDQVRLDTLLEDEAGDTAPTDEEIQAEYDAAVAQQEATGQTATPLPPLEDVREQIEQQLVGGKISEAAQALLVQLREDADITVNL